MKDCRWLKPKLVAQFEFVEWTPDNHLRHSRFVALREDKPARTVFRETAKGNEKLDRSSRDETDWLDYTGRPVRDRNEPSA
jgi:ATP-dependent DNA ligase